MTIYKRSFVATLIISVISFLVAIILNYALHEQFWCNVLLGIFGGAVLTAITSIIGYFVERRHTLEEFYVEATKLLKHFNKYRVKLTIDQKVNFFLELSNYDTTCWSTTFARIDLFDKKSKKYIYEKIYKPLMGAYKNACSYTEHFEMQINGMALTNAAIEEIVNKLEAIIIREEEYIVGSNKKEIIVKSSYNRIVKKFHTELNGKYYEIMYGKKKAKENREVTKN